MEIGTCRCRTAPARVLRDEHEGKAFIRRELGSVFAEIDQGRGPEAFNIAAIRGQIEVGFQNSGFAVMTFEPVSEPDLPEFILQAAGLRPEERRATCMVMVEPPIILPPESIARPARKRDSTLMPGWCQKYLSS